MIELEIGGLLVNEDRGTEKWYNKKGELHRPNGLPAVLDDQGYEAGYINGDLQYWIWKGRRTDGDFSEDKP